MPIDAASCALTVIVLVPQQRLCRALGYNTWTSTNMGKERRGHGRSITCRVYHPMWCSVCTIEA